MGVESAGFESEFEQLLAAASLYAQPGPEPLASASLGSTAHFVPDCELALTNDSIATLVPLYRLEFERIYALPIEHVWSAVSDANELAAWMKYPVSLESRVGGLIRVDFAPDKPLEGIISAFEPLRSLAFTWGDSIVKWDLDAADSSTTLRLSHIGVSRELSVGLGAGWHAFLDQLEDHLCSSSRPDRYVDLTERYHAALRPLLIH